MYENKKVLVLGLSKSGIAAAKFLNTQKANVYISEFRQQKNDDIKKIKELNALGIKIEMGGHSDEFLSNVNLCITSPGIPPKSEVFAKLKNNGVNIISEVELAFLNTNTPFVVITGTNGKTTTTALTNHIISSQFASQACGNIGCPPCDLLSENLDFFVCELSSYQLEMSPTFKPRVAVFTNFTPDHIDWHGGLENYFKAKAKIFADNQCADFCIFNAKDKKLAELAKQCPTTVFYFDENKGENCCYIENNFFVYKKDGIFEKIINVDFSPMVGHHNYQNIMCAIICAKLSGVTNENIAESIKTFITPHHRLEKVATINNTTFYNDSKATNPEASIVAMKSFCGKSVAQIVGGTDKHTSLEEFCNVAKNTVHTIILIGQAANRFEQELTKNDYTNIIKADSLSDAVNVALGLNLDVCLLSPACASFDMFNSYEHRGDVFKNLVLKII